MFETGNISDDTRDVRVLRLVACFVAVIALVAMVVGPDLATWILVLLALDFAVRGLGRGAYSPLNALARRLAGAFELAPAPVDAGPKRFAARTGVVVALVAAGLYMHGYMVAATATTGSVAICAALEGTFAICVASRVHALLPERLAGVLAK